MATETRLAGVRRTTVCRWLSDPEFAAAVQAVSEDRRSPTVLTRTPSAASADSLVG